MMKCIFSGTTEPKAFNNAAGAAANFRDCQSLDRRKNSRRQARLGGVTTKCKR